MLIISNISLFVIMKIGNVPFVYCLDVMNMKCMTLLYIGQLQIVFSSKKKRNVISTNIKLLRLLSATLKPKTFHYMSWCHVGHGCVIIGKFSFVRAKFMVYLFINLLVFSNTYYFKKRLVVESIVRRAQLIENLYSY